MAFTLTAVILILAFVYLRTAAEATVAAGR
jgi:hypothetical protein